MLEQRNRAIAKHPGTTFIGAHFGNNPEDLETVGKWLEAYPNFYYANATRLLGLKSTR